MSPPEPQLTPSSPGDPSPAAAPNAERWNLPVLLVASAATLFIELALIRWLAVEIRVFAYFKNLTLLLCFVGFGLGCALARYKVRWLLGVEALVGLIVVIRFPLGMERRQSFFEHLSWHLGGADDTQVWQTWALRSNLTDLLAAALVTVALSLAIIAIFIPLGQVVSRQFDAAPRVLHAYSWNLAASLAGIVAFTASCWFSLPPLLWLSAALFLLAMLQPNRRQALLVGLLIVPTALLLYDKATRDQFVVWTPYQQIGFKRLYVPGGEAAGARITVNRTGYQRLLDMSDPFLDRHPGLLQEERWQNPYNLPFRFAAASPEVLIVGAGTGNDAAAALRHGSSRVDAVEIDPVIWQVGVAEHPEQPYADPRVHRYVTDARAFLKRTDRRYDLILFGLLDSHTNFSDYSNMRIDNFVYTLEAFQEARRLLKPDGVLFVKFEIQRPWIARRMRELLTTAFGKPPLTFFAQSTYTVPGTCFVASQADQVEQVLARDSQLAGFVAAHPPQMMGAEPVPLTTDDWPYLYNQGRWIPRTYWTISVLVLLVGIGLYLSIPATRGRLPSLFFFSMGAGFMLLETQVISRLALFFGTTWQVNSVVIAALLTTLLFANFVVEKFPAHLSRRRILAGLFLGLLSAYVFPMERLPGPAWGSGLLAAALFSIPVFFAGLLFATEFRDSRSPSADLGANMLGAVLGGLLENVSLIFGMNALLVVAAILYAGAAFGLLRPPLGAAAERPTRVWAWASRDARAPAGKD